MAVAAVSDRRIYLFSKLLMDTDKSGKVSKKEFMAFMSKEFDRLDTNHDGELDVNELAKWQVHPYVGK